MYRQTYEDTAKELLIIDKILDHYKVPKTETISFWVAFRLSQCLAHECWDYDEEYYKAQQLVQSIAKTIQ